MKKIVSFFATIAAVAALTACSQDDSPVLQKPTEFKLNTPPFAAELYQLSPDGQIELTCSQPNYGVGTQTTYSLEYALNEDFTEPTPIEVADKYNATLTFSTKDLTLSLCERFGIEDEDTWAPYANMVMPLYFRATAIVGNAEYSKISSNIVKLDNVRLFYPFNNPGYIYLTGYPSFEEPTKANKDKLIRLYESEDAIGSKVYSAVINDVPAGSVAFRFYTKLTGWGANNCLGAGLEDMKDIDVSSDFKDGEYNGEIVVGGQSNWTFTWTGGDMTITVDLNDNTIKIQSGAVENHPTTYVYMVGNCGGAWTEPLPGSRYETDYALVCSDGSGVYSATFNNLTLADDAAGSLYCRFYQALNGWGAAQWAATSKDYVVTSGNPAPTTVGEDCFKLEDADGKNVMVELDTNANTVTFTFVE